MAEQPQPTAISAAFPAPPPFYKSFTPQNLAQLAQQSAPHSQSSTGTFPPSTPIPDLTSLPPELRNLIPPPLPPNGQYRSFGTLHNINPTPSDENTLTPTPTRLKGLTHELLFTFLSLTHTLATNPGAYPPVWEHLQETFQDVFKVLNAYRPHQARETLILMMEEQVRTIRAETDAVRESVGRAREVVERLGKGGEGGDMNGSIGEVESEGEKRRRIYEMREKRVWEVLEREVGRI
ncbi:hypothetical protein N7G274_002568 [Stereocaulon virgatum]|uniref:Mediator of RNA polymerase II transcription subunit 7 n=1 Tax=Stereocaulon virgatum TaxID=373712 RepID=A0ABR4AI62_9LECA